MFKAAVFTISDSRAAGRRNDESGPQAEALLPDLGCTCVHRQVIPDEQPQIEQALRDWSSRADLIITTGGTGIAPRDVTPEAAAAVIERPLPGFGEIMRSATFEQMPLSIISRSGAGILGCSLIVYLPGSPAAVRDCLRIIAPAVRHVLKALSQPGFDCAEDRAAAAQR